MSTTAALYNRPTRTHRGLTGFSIEAGGERYKTVERQIFEENFVRDGDELAFVIRRRGRRMPHGRSRSDYYGIQEQKKHIQWAHEEFGTALAYGHEHPCPCDNCNLDDPSEPL